MYAELVKARKHNDVLFTSSFTVSTISAFKWGDCNQLRDLCVR